MKKAASISEACDRVVGKMKGGMTTEEIVEAVTKLYPSKAKNPTSSVMNTIRSRNDVVALGKGKYARADQIAEGAKFRIVIAEDDLILGILKTHYFKPFDLFMKPIECEFVDGAGKTIPVVQKSLELGKLDDLQLMDAMLALGESKAPRDITQGIMEDLQSLMSAQEEDDDDDEDWDEDDEDDEDWDDDEFDDDDDDDDEAVAEQFLKDVLQEVRRKIDELGVPPMEVHDFADYFRRARAKAGDSLIVTVHPARKTFVFEHEPAKRARTAFIEEHDEEIRRLFHAAIKNKKKAWIGEIVLRAYATLPWMKEYPCHHWFDIVEQDDDLRILRVMGDNWEIASIDYSIPLDLVDMDLTTARKLEKRREALEQEADEFFERMQAAIFERVGKLEPHEAGGPANVIKKTRLGRDEDAIMDHNIELIDGFCRAGVKQGDDEDTMLMKGTALEELAEYLLEAQEIPLEQASLDDLGQFIFDWYPENGILSAPYGIQQMIGYVRDFYQYLVKSRIIRNAAFAEAIYDLRDQVAEKVEFVRRMPPGPPPF